MIYIFDLFVEEFGLYGKLKYYDIMIEEGRFREKVLIFYKIVKKKCYVDENEW